MEWEKGKTTQDAHVDMTCRVSEWVHSIFGILLLRTVECLRVQRLHLSLCESRLECRRGSGPIRRGGDGLTSGSKRLRMCYHISTRHTTIECWEWEKLHQ